MPRPFDPADIAAEDGYIGSVTIHGKGTCVAQTKLDHVFAKLAVTRDDFEARRQVLDEAAHVLLHKPSLGGQIIARVCAVQENGPDLEEMLDLTSAALSAARISHESGQKRGAALITTMEEALKLPARQNRLDTFHRLALARAWA